MPLLFAASNAPVASREKALRPFRRGKNRIFQRLGEGKRWIKLDMVEFYGMRSHGDVLKRFLLNFKNVLRQM